VSSIIEELHKIFSAPILYINCIQSSKIGQPPGAGVVGARLPSRSLADLVELAAAGGNAAGMTRLSDVLQLRVRYSETDQMGTFYNSRALEWFECGRTELMRRRLGMSYAALEARGVFLPLVEAHLEFQGGARYDDLLEITSAVDISGRAKLRFDVQIHQTENRKPVVRGYTVHAFTDRQGKPIRPPAWFVELLARAME
jgi:acyl-CoA thioester hydrolase